MYVRDLKASPYAELCGSKQHQRVLELFAREACAVMGLPKDAEAYAEQRHRLGITRCWHADRVATRPRSAISLCLYLPDFTRTELPRKPSGLATLWTCDMPPIDDEVGGFI